MSEIVSKTAGGQEELKRLLLNQFLCSKCGKNKDSSFFYKNKRSKTGFSVWCKPCSKNYYNEYYSNNKSKLINYQRKYYEENKNYVNERQKRYVEKNIEKVKKYQSNIYIKNKNQRAEYIRNYYKTNKESILEKCREYRIKNKESKRERDSKWKKENRLAVLQSCHARRARIKNSGGSFTKDQINEMLNSQKFACNLCGISILNKYHIDHIKPISKGGDNWITNIQLLCPKCNLSKGSKYG